MRIQICLAIFAALSCQAQQTSAPQPGPVQALGRGVKINVIQGEGAVNNIRSRIGAPIEVEVRDGSGKPIPRAEVIFELPASGPSGVFFGYLRNQTVRTDNDGKAAATGFTPNEEAGRFLIKVTANSGTETTSVNVTQTNSTTGGNGGGKQAKSGHGNLWKVILIVGAAGLAGGIYAATRGSGSSSTPPTPVTISAGPITIGGPR